MSVFIEVTTDAFQENFDKRARAAKEQRRRAGSENVRRPMRGLEIKDDTYGIIKVIASDGSEISLFDSSSDFGESKNYSNFILQSVSEARMEKHQIVETFGEAYIFFFGEAPRFLDVTAVLIDSHDFNWEAEWWANYDKYFRGTKLVEMGARAYIFYDDNIVEGYMLNAQVVKSSQFPLMAQLSFRLYLTNYSNISLIGDPNFPVRGSLVLPPEVGDINAIATDRGAYLATLGANLQQAGFGGGAQFQQAFKEGGSFADVPEQLYGVFLNAVETLGELSKHPERFSRKQPLRSLIGDNLDEYTTPVASLDAGIDEQAKLEDEVENLVQQAEQLLKQLGVQNPPSDRERAAQFAQNNPFVQQANFANAMAANNVQRALDHKMMRDMGFGPSFMNTGVPIGYASAAGAPATFGARAGFNASFGARAGVSFGGSIGGGLSARAGGGFGAGLGGGIGGGLGLSGRGAAGFGGGFNPSAPYAPNTSYANQYGYSKRLAGVARLNLLAFGDKIDTNFFNSYQTSQNYNNGVRVGGGLTMGVGIAGGVGKPFAVQTFSGTLPPGNTGFFNVPGSPTYNPLLPATQPSFPIGYNSAATQAANNPYAIGYGPAPASFYGFNNVNPNGTFGGPGNGGASVSIGGRPTAFSLVSAGGVLTPNGLETFHYSF